MESITGVTGMESDMKCSREKNWEELTTDEKVEKLASTVDLLARWAMDIERTATLLTQHQHGSNGKVLIPFHHSQLEQALFKRNLLNRKPAE